MKQETPGNQPKKEEREKPARPTSVPEGKQESGPPRALGNQTELGDQTELNVAGDRPKHEPAEETHEHDEELAHSNSSADHAAYKTKTGERDPAGLQGG